MEELHLHAFKKFFTGIEYFTLKEIAIFEIVAETALWQIARIARLCVCFIRTRNINGHVFELHVTYICYSKINWRICICREWCDNNSCFCICWSATCLMTWLSMITRPTGERFRLEEADQILRRCVKRERRRWDMKALRPISQFGGHWISTDHTTNDLSQVFKGAISLWWNHK
jgi:hypothetical protein